MRRSVRSDKKKDNAEIKNWFSDLVVNITAVNALDVFEDPDRIFFLDETIIQLCKSTEKFVIIRGQRNVSEVAPARNKSTLTFVGTFSASGSIVAPSVIYPYLGSLCGNIYEKVPADFHIAHSKTGLLKSANLHEYIRNAFLPWINQTEIQKPVILFIDGDSSQLTLQVSTLCKDNGIIPYLLPPNSAHCLQPAEVGPFKALQQYWQEEVTNYESDDTNETLKLANVAPLMKKVLMRITCSSIKDGFRTTGLYPLHADFSKSKFGETVDTDGNNQQSKVQSIAPTMTDQREKYRCALEVIEFELGEKRLETLKKNPTLLPRNTLYLIYQSIKAKSGIGKLESETYMQTLASSPLSEDLMDTSSESSVDGFEP